MGMSMRPGINLQNLVLMFGLFIICIVVAYILATQEMFWAMGVVLGTAFFAIGFLSPRFSLYILILSMLLSPEIGQRDLTGEGFSIRMEDLLLIVMGFAWLTKTAVQKNIGLAVKTDLNRPIFIYMLVCIVSTALGIMIGNVKSPLTGIMFVLKYFEYFVVFFLTLNNITNRRDIKILLTVLFLTYMIVIIIGFSQIPRGIRISAPFEGKDSEPNTLGGYLMLLLSVNIVLFLNVKEKMLKFGLGILAFFSFVGILYTLSRASWLASFVMYISLIMFTKKKRKILVFALLAGLIFAPFTMPDEVIERALYTFQKEPGEAMFTEAEAQYIKEAYNVDVDGSTAARLDSMKEVLRDFAKHPLLGYGVTGYHFIDAQFHKVLIETGIIGLFTFISLLFMTAKLLYRNMKKYSEDPLYNALATGTFCGLMGLIAHSVGTNTFIIVRIMEPFWCLVALNLAIPIIEESETSLAA